MDLGKDPHRRFNPLSNEWVIVSPQRTQRPWQGQVEELARAREPEYDPTCYLCPGNSRAGGAVNPRYASTFAFNNDYPALKPDIPPERMQLDANGLLAAESEPGLCRVMCFSPRHDLTLATMQANDIEEVVRAWTEETRQLGGDPRFNHVQIFENRGAMMGASNPHPHCQILATASIPQAPARELTCQKDYLDAHGICLLCAYAKLEEERKARIVCENDGFVALVPFWAVWPFEILLLSRRHLGAMPEFTPPEVSALAQILQQVTSTYNRVFDAPFPYTMGFHQSPADGNPHPEWHFHAHFYPPLLRSATIRKFMVGFEMLGTPQRDITAEGAAERLRARSGS